MIVFFTFILYFCSALILSAIYGNSELKPCFWLFFTMFCPIINTVILLYILIKRIRIITIKTSFKEFIKQLKEI